MTKPFHPQNQTASSAGQPRSLERVFRFSNSSRPLRSGRLSVAGFTQLMLLFTLLVSGVAASSLSGVLAQDGAADESLELAAGWLVDQQAEDGGFPGFSGESDPATTADALIALASAHNNGVAVDFEPAQVYLSEHALVYAQTGPGSAAKLSLALSATGQDPRDFAAVNPLSLVQAAASSGLIGFGPYEHALGLLALVAAGEQVPEAAIAVAFETQTEDGGWSFDGSIEAGAADTNTTAVMVQALIAAGLASEDAVNFGIEYLLAAQVDDGGFPYQPGGPADANSTALALQALLAAGHGEGDPGVDSAFTTLQAFQNDNGSFSWMLDPRDDNMFSTLQAMPALAGDAMPVVAADSVAPPEASPAALVHAA